MSTPEVQVPRHRLTVDEYYRMAELGILGPSARVPHPRDGNYVDVSVADRPSTPFPVALPSVPIDLSGIL